MNSDQLKEGNRLIAEFMGAEKLDENSFTYNREDKFIGNCCSVDDLEYHSSWDWLMPVVEKIESLDGGEHGNFGVHITSNSCNIQGSNLWKTLQGKSTFPVYMSDPNAILDTKIESTWYNVVEFIKWYNKKS